MFTVAMLLSIWRGLFLVSEMSLQNILNNYEKIIYSTKKKQISTHLKQTQIRCKHLNRHLSPPWTQKTLQHRRVTHINSCHWPKWQINTANGGKGNTAILLNDGWQIRLKTDKFAEENINSGKWARSLLSWCKSRKENTSLFLLNCSEGQCAWMPTCQECAHTLKYVSIAIQGKEKEHSHKTLPENWSGKTR